jgi:hypothetical protein
VRAGKRGSPLCCVGWRAVAEAGSRCCENCLRVRTGDPQGDDLVVRYPKGLRHLIKAVGGRTTRITSTQTQHDLGLTCTRQTHLLLEASFHGRWLHRVLLLAHHDPASRSQCWRPLGTPTGVPTVPCCNTPSCSRAIHQQHPGRHETSAKSHRSDVVSLPSDLRQPCHFQNRGMETDRRANSALFDVPDANLLHLARPDLCCHWFISPNSSSSPPLALYVVVCSGK